MAPEHRITGVVLAGGMARRMGGSDKGLIELAGKPLATHLAERLAPQVDHLIINANRNNEIYAAMGHSVVPDAIGNYDGPLAGFYSAMIASDTEWLITAPCDSPLLPEDYVSRMRAAVGGSSICVATDGKRLQPVFSLLRTTLVPSLLKFLESGERKIDRWFESEGMVTADFSDHPEMFRNVNTPEELAELEAEFFPAS